MKRKLVLILASILMLLSLSMLCACGGGNNEEDGENESLNGIVFSSKEIEYDGEFHNIEALNIPEYATYSYDTDKGYKDVGVYECTFYANLDGDEINLKATLTIKKATIKVFAQEKIIYKGQPANFGYSLSGFKGKDTISVIDVLPTLKSINYKDVGTYNNVIAFEGASDNNYDFSYVSANLIIEEPAKPQILGNNIVFGKYPQTLVSDSDLTATLENKVSVGELSCDVDSGWYNYNGNSYAGIVAKNHVQMDSFTSFNNGQEIVEGKFYFFKVEPINWKVIKSDGGKYCITTDLLIDNVQFNADDLEKTVNGEKILPNDWKYSDLRNWLNNEFMLMAFGNSTYISEYSHQVGYNSISDKIGIFSLNDVLDSSLGFNNDESRKVLFSDYSRAKGAYMPVDGYGYYWLSDVGGIVAANNARVKIVKCDGSVGDDCYFNVDNFCGVRPYIVITDI